jgi:hypothetical protein
MGKTENIECPWFSFTLAFTILGSKPAELDQPCLVLMEFQAKLQKTFPKISQEPFSVFAVLKANHKVIAIPGPHFPLSSLRLQPYDCTRMTRGRCDSLILHRMKLSFTTSRRFCRRTNIGVDLNF